MTLTAKDVEEALRSALEAVRTDCGCSECVAHRTATAILKRLIDSGFVEAAMAYQEWCEQTELGIPQMDTGQSYAWIKELAKRQAALRDAFRRLKGSE